MTAKKLNGSTGLLADALHQAFTEVLETAVGTMDGKLESVIKPIGEEMQNIRSDMKSMESRLGGRIDETNSKVNTLSENVHKELGDQPRLISEEVNKVLERRGVIGKS